MGTIGFHVQLYCDFSGYSDMAIGLAAIMGFKLLPNFNSPYKSLNVTEFWRRWHISLMTWFRDYVYIPLGGSRCAQWKVIRNTFIVFGVSGLWHGANWTFVCWGLYHGCLIVLYKLLHINTKDKEILAAGRWLLPAGNGLVGASLSKRLEHPRGAESQWRCTHYRDAPDEHRLRGYGVLHRHGCLRRQ